MGLGFLKTVFISINLSLPEMYTNFILNPSVLVDVLYIY